ncbi:GNAT family N-acetyltransferase [Hahella sp. CCB-MM4]|uniref:GNAT family N-acetyltransferase n=1 Tax=Hahella sp. (strain CCB-MM4) TaxID=1926491 RepID=UPI000B9AE1B7|nr:GNAT family N-acetyltransferase [Hahella sp. CCB-MM4]OZG73822.1 GNAT family N-acetyltransferase [Hahella sp. CCB-MM4]
MNIRFERATPEDAEIIATMVVQLTREICERTGERHFDIDVSDTRNRCEELLKAGLYLAIIGYCDHQAVALATVSETYALYAKGKIGVVQEFFVEAGYRSSGVGQQLLEQVSVLGEQRGWACIELCTPPLPEFERTLAFYQNNGLTPVGGRKMRRNFY